MVEPLMPFVRGKANFSFGRGSTEVDGLQLSPIQQPDTKIAPEDMQRTYLRTQNRREYQCLYRQSLSNWFNYVNSDKDRLPPVSTNEFDEWLKTLILLAAFKRHYPTELPPLFAPDSLDFAERLERALKRIEVPKITQTTLESLRNRGEQMVKSVAEKFGGDQRKALGFLQQLYLSEFVLRVLENGRIVVERDPNTNQFEPYILPGRRGLLEKLSTLVRR